MDKNKKAIIGTIFAITSLLAGLSIYVSWELRRDLAPEDTSADVGTPVPTVIEPTKDIDKKTEPTKVPPTKVTPTKVPPTKVPPTSVPVTSAPGVTKPVGGGGGVIATPVPSGPLPSTALVNDRVDTLIFGSLLMLTGIILYRKYFYFGNKHQA
ncbi:MAG TPA: hypothetical protein PKU78_02895 [Candidatus Dojkabacteria bacterium]|nr:hypothetical protein [Candidatus Dojkabacteria bacterium]HRO65141.1 hypothetical protein [Candidatus Dojkabacteria bacterium]HRP36436.1 hypothetical protein [Candidatus Dojkabacteria bacterium]HRP50678.1 hypothetical protein [Candidatus Dojkabacteria bacterium]